MKYILNILLLFLLAISFFNGFHSFKPDNNSDLSTNLLYSNKFTNNNEINQTPPININSNSDFLTYSSSGNGSLNNPYIIYNLFISLENSSVVTGAGISISNTDDYFILKQITIIGGKYISGIVLRGVKNGIIENCTIINAKIGIYLLFDSNFNAIRDNYILNCFSSFIDVQQSFNNTIIHNSLDLTRSYNSSIYTLGIYIQASINTTITDNIMKNTGVYLEGELSVVSTQFILNNLVNGKQIIIIKNAVNQTLNLNNAGQIILINSSFLAIKDQLFSNSTAGIEVIGSHDILIQNNSITTTSYGISIYYSYNISLISNSIIETSNGIFMRNSETITVLHNEISKAFECISTLFVSNSTIMDNKNKAIAFSGLILDSSSNNIIKTNIIEGSEGNAISFQGANNNFLIQNIVKNNKKYGIFLSYSSNNSIINNNVNNNKNYGFYANGNSEFNKIYLNNFISNGNFTSQAYTGSLKNYWTNGTFGNYWSDYSGVDSNNDGVGEESYNIDSNYLGIIDSLPLMQPYVMGRVITTIPSTNTNTVDSKSNHYPPQPNDLIPIAITSLGLSLVLGIMVSIRKIKNKGKTVKTNHVNNFKQPKRPGKPLSEETMNIIEDILNEDQT